MLNPAKYPSNPKKALLLYLDNKASEPIKFAKHLWEEVKNDKINILKIDPKSVDDYGYKKIVFEEKGTIEKLINKYNIEIKIQE